MSDQKTVIFGAGGHARVAIDTMRHSGSAVPVACLDRNGTARSLLDVAVLDEHAAHTLLAQGVTYACIAVGDPVLRDLLARRAETIGFALLTLVSSRAYVSESALIGAGVVIFAGAVVQPSSRVDRLAIVNTAASVDHDCQVGALSHIAPGAVLCGGVKIGQKCWIGAGSVTVEQVTIADDVLIAAGAVVTRDIVEPGGRFGGVPARRLTQSRTAGHA